VCAAANSAIVRIPNLHWSRTPTGFLIAKSESSQCRQRDPNRRPSPLCLRNIAGSFWDGVFPAHRAQRRRSELRCPTTWSSARKDWARNTRPAARPNASVMLPCAKRWRGARNLQRKTANRGKTTLLKTTLLKILTRIREPSQDDLSRVHVHGSVLTVGRRSRRRYVSTSHRASDHFRQAL